MQLPKAREHAMTHGKVFNSGDPANFGRQAFGFIGPKALKVLHACFTTRKTGVEMFVDF